MIDRFSRPLRGLRISVTYRCNFRCFFCHAEGLERGPVEELRPREVELLARAASSLGASEAKLTGGEPLTRGDAVDLVSAAKRGGINEISMTTNGSLLSDLARELAEAGLRRVNISLHSLNPRLFRGDHEGRIP
ncbi:MAG: radical SAM protein [Fervidicoccaceae archaeon]